MSPILVRPVREQFEHDRVIRVLHARYRRKFEVVINPGSEQNAPVGGANSSLYPDVILYSPQRGRRLQATIEVETTESVNTLEALAEWGPYSRLRAPFFLYLPPGSLDAARRLCVEHQVMVAEIWTYHTSGDQIRFTLVHRAPQAAAGAEREAARREKPPSTRAARKKAAAPAKKRAGRAAGGRAARSGRRARATFRKPAPKMARTGKRR